MTTLYLEIKKLKNQIGKMKLKLMIMEGTLNQLETIVNQKRTIHGEPLADKIAKMIMNHPEKKASQREILRKFTDKRLGDIIVLRKILESKYSIKIRMDSHQKIIYYK